ncbi:flagellar biosynthesis protein FlhA [Desulfuromonas acetoxidans]|uniref:Flagellar biosynthesis protein FlhA n=1 Tax=Desulfuromonas acetoxidans (strain DSM 684 / 11070) TaxID=281689 RepID=Q1JZS0_DESA6|nr:flagellar biosynthesis protein FlhA [Desulfuromonas acetoxidans]EAT15822.1 flagellar biosynthesis protein FlhA [Desulfuromonas acetoxidans DSM 684]NVD25633.1 flagellar biosynthesis protein FlhA [Desulfuromonas acetoxidans]
MLEALAENKWVRLIVRSDIMVSLGLVMVLMLMIIPLPPVLLDIFLSLNITLALLILIISLYTAKSVEFAVFPAVLLATTLFRLSLNVASTRLILLHGEEGPSAAGSVIMSFGQFVVGGNYVVGLVIFVILVLINFMVITKGAGRVAEVAARFTLDAMPGKQMAIDADLNAGLINDQEAKVRRAEIANEADFYGAMDGASKFVRGDAIAGIIITLINIGAGFIIGVVQKGMPAIEAAQNYTILTVGDGLVGQVPALIISTAAGILVTRTAGTGDFGTDLKAQFSVHPQAVWVVSVILLAFALIPGLPFAPFLILSALLAFIAFQLQKTQAQEQEAAEAISMEQARPEAREKEDDYDEMLNVDLLELEVGYGLIPFVDAAQDGELLERIRSIRKQFALDSGFIVPPVHIKDNLQLKPNEYNFMLKGVKVAGAEMLPGHFMAMNPGMATETIKGVATEEPAFGLPATWISEDKKERAQIAGYTVVDCTTVMATHISEIIKRYAYELLGRQEVQNLLDNLKKSYPKLVEELVPEPLNLGLIMRVLQNLLREDVSIRDLRTILETLADYAAPGSDPDYLTEHVRSALARSISGKYAQADDVLAVMTLDRKIEEGIQQSLQKTDSGIGYLAMEPRQAQAVLDALAEQLQQFSGGMTPVLLCSPTIRPHVKKTTERYLPSLVVISHNEIASHLKVRSIGMVKINAG